MTEIIMDEKMDSIEKLRTDGKGLYEENEKTLEDLKTLADFFRKQKITKEMLEEMKKCTEKVMFLGIKTEQEKKVLARKLMLDLYFSSTKKVKKHKQSSVKKHNKKKAIINAQCESLVEEKKEIKKYEENFYRNLANFVGKREKNSKKVSYEKIMKFFKDELIQKDQTIYKSNFKVQELKKKLKKQHIREQQNAQTKTFSKIDFDQLRRE